MRDQPSPSHDVNTLSLLDAQARLAALSCQDNPAIATLQERTSLRQALLQVTAAADYHIFGVCADSLEQGVTALNSYLRALGYPTEVAFNPVDGAVYIKSNPGRKLCYAQPYTGEYSGVLVSCQSDDPDGVNDTYGHFPLDLFTDYESSFATSTSS
jgi:hypothetical protein